MKKILMLRKYPRKYVRIRKYYVCNIISNNSGKIYIDRYREKRNMVKY